MCVQGSISVTRHVEAAFSRPVRPLSRAVERLPHPRGARWKELGGSGRWIQRLVQLQAPGENSLFFRRGLPAVEPRSNLSFCPLSSHLPVPQADVCHAYQIVHKNGIPDEQIVVMMYDDLATNDE